MLLNVIRLSRYIASRYLKCCWHSDTAWYQWPEWSSVKSNYVSSKHAILLPLFCGWVALKAHMRDTLWAQSYIITLCVLLCPTASRLLCTEFHKNITTIIITASARCTTLSSFKSLVLWWTPCHRLCHSNLDFCPKLCGTVGKLADQKWVQCNCSHRMGGAGICRYNGD